MPAATRRANGIAGLAEKAGDRAGTCRHCDHVLLHVPDQSPASDELLPLTNLNKRSGRASEMAKRQMHLMAYLKTGATSTHPGGWRHPEADLHDIFLPSRYEHIARVLESSFFDGCFYADTQGVPDIYNNSFEAYIHHGGQLSYLDPLTILPVMAAATKHLGLGATLSTTFHHPYHLARTLASLDLLSNGRACWNVVTSSTNFEARNFGMEKLPEKDVRYDIGDEVLEACCALWNCWEPGFFDCLLLLSLSFLSFLSLSSSELELELSFLAITGGELARPTDSISARIRPVRKNLFTKTFPVLCEDSRLSWMVGPNERDTGQVYPRRRKATIETPGISGI